MNLEYIIAILSAGIVAGTPILYASLGEVIAERSGIMNLGVEGMVLVGAVTAFSASIASGNAWVGFLAAAGAGALLALIHAVLTIGFRANQVTSGIALTIFGTGLSAYLGRSLVGMPPVVTFRAVTIPGLSQIPFFGPVLFKQDLLVYLSIILVAILWFIFNKNQENKSLKF